MTIEVKNDEMLGRTNENTLHIELIKLQQENQELKAKIKTYEDPDDLTLMFMYCDEKAKDKIKELKKQLEEYKNDYFKLSKENNEYAIKLHNNKNQQKEFIEYLENEINKIKE